MNGEERKEYENPHWLTNWLKLHAKHEEEEFSNLDKVKEKLTTICFIQQGYKGKVVIEDYPNLKQLNLSNNELEEVIVRNCPDLKLVSLAHNKLTKLKIENCPSVKEIYTHNNQLTKWDVDVEDLKSKNLRVISYSDNPLTTEEKTRLDALGLKDRVVESRINGPAQEWLDSKYPLDIRDSIEKLDISELGLQGNLDLRGFTNLKSLYCSGNELTNLYLDDCEKLEYLECSNNELFELDVSNNLELQELHANHNKIGKMDFSGLSKLHTLMLTSNYLKEINLTDLTNLKTLNCAINDLEELNLEKNIKLESLYCYENFLESLNIKHLKDLEYLYCYRNSLKELDCSGLDKLREFYCANCLIRNLKIDDCRSLEILDCAENDLEELVVVDKPKLKTISGKENVLEKLDIVNLPNLEFLDFSRQEKDIEEDEEAFLPVKTTLNIKNSSNIREMFCDKSAIVPNWKTFPNLELVGFGETKTVKNEKGEDEGCYFVDEINCLAQRNINKIENIINNPDSISLEDLIKIKGKALDGVSDELKQQLLLLSKNKIWKQATQEETNKAKDLLANKNNLDDFLLMIHLELLNFNLLEPETKERVTKLLTELKKKWDSDSESESDSDSESEEKETPPSTPPSEDEQETPPDKQDKNKDKDQLIRDLEKKNEELEAKLRELENDKGNPAEINKKKEEIRKEIIDSQLSEEQKQELLRQLEGLTKKINDEVEISPSTPLHYWGWLFVIVGWIVLVGLIWQGKKVAKSQDKKG